MLAQVSERIVLSQKAYILFYMRRSVAPLPSPSPPAPKVLSKGEDAPAQVQVGGIAHMPSDSELLSFDRKVRYCLRNFLSLMVSGIIRHNRACLTSIEMRVRGPRPCFDAMRFQVLCNSN